MGWENTSMGWDGLCQKETEKKKKERKIIQLTITTTTKDMFKIQQNFLVGNHLLNSYHMSDSM